MASTNTRDASKWVQMHFPETQFILWHHGNNIHVEKEIIHLLPTKVYVGETNNEKMAANMVIGITT